MKKQRLRNGLLCIAFFMIVFPMLGTKVSYQAASSYTNAKQFYNSTAQKGEYYHAESAYGKIYYATQAKLASSNTNTKYYTLGFDITMYGNGHSVSFSVQRTGGSMKEISSVKDGTYEYILYAIEEDKLYELASKADSTNASLVLNAETIEVYMDAIMTTKKGDTPNGGITENGFGGITDWGTIYRLKNSADLSALKQIFSGHAFKSYTDIYVPINNYLLNVRYAVNGTKEASDDASSTVTVENGYRLVNYTENGITVPYVLYANGGCYTSSARMVDKIMLFDPQKAGMKKTGYHLVAGSEWTTEQGAVFAAGKAYQSIFICPAVGTANKNIYLYANWKPNEIKIQYNANGGNGTILPSYTTYDKPVYLAKNTFTRTGFKLKEGAEWNTKKDGTGTSYSNSQLVKNLISEGELVLYANWVPCVYKISNDKQGGNNGTDYFYEKYAYGFYQNETCTKGISAILVPKKTGFAFEGYYTNMLGNGTRVVDSNGAILTDSLFFTKDTTIFANWSAQRHHIFFDKKDGEGGTDRIQATYGKLVPFAEGPYKEGYTFEGYYLNETYSDETQYYSSAMTPLQMFLFEQDITLYAKWKDDISPRVMLKVQPADWTNRALGVEVSASAKDEGSGLEKVVLYCEGVPVAIKDHLGGTKEEVEIAYTHMTESIYSYQVIAYDADGNIAETYGICKYDITKPNGEYDVRNEDPYDFSIHVDAWDYVINP